jgi:hypothetical protein
MQPRHDLKQSVNARLGVLFAKERLVFLSDALLDFCPETLNSRVRTGAALTVAEHPDTPP